MPCVRFVSVSVHQLERLEEMARAAALAWSSHFGVVVTPDVIALGALFAVPPELQRAVEALAEHLRDED